MSGTDFNLLTIGDRTATANYSSGTDIYTLVKSTSNTTFTQQTSAGGFVLGVLYGRPSSGQVAPIQIGGIALVRVDTTSHSAIAVGDKLTCSTSAAALPSTTVAKFVFGRAMETLAANTTGLIKCHLTFEGAGSSGTASAG